MRPIRYATKELVRAFDARKVLDLAQVKAALGTPVKMTALRQLRQLDYHSSYSHAGRYYTLERIARWDGHGLWSSTGIRFSRHGTLVETMAQLVDAAAGGWVSAELEDVLGVRVHAALLSLYRRGRVRRHQIGGAYLYVSVHDGSAQLAHRQQQVQAEAVSFMGLGLEADLRPHLQAFLATLNEKQRRLYAGFESLRLGRGGDTIVAGWTGLNVKTVARGRQELHSGGVSIDRVRAVGAGRPALKKGMRIFGLDFWRLISPGPIFGLGSVFRNPTKGERHGAVSRGFGPPAI